MAFALLLELATNALVLLPAMIYALYTLNPNARRPGDVWPLKSDALLMCPHTQYVEMDRIW